MSFLRGAGDGGETPVQHRDDLARVVDRQRRLRDEGELVGIARREGLGIRDGLDQRHAPSGSWPIVPITSGWPAWPMSRISSPRRVLLLGLDVDLGDQRAGRVEMEEIAARGLGRHRLGHAMRRKHHRRAVIGDFVEFLDEDRALGLQILHHRPVVDDLMPDVDRRAKSFAKPARRSGSRGRRRRRSRAARRAGSSAEACARTARPVMIARRWMSLKQACPRRGDHAPLPSTYKACDSALSTRRCDVG